MKSEVRFSVVAERLVAPICNSAPASFVRMGTRGLLLADSNRSATKAGECSMSAVPEAVSFADSVRQEPSCKESTCASR